MYKDVPCQFLINITGTCCTPHDWACRSRWRCPRVSWSVWITLGPNSLQTWSMSIFDKQKQYLLYLPWLSILITLGQFKKIFRWKIVYTWGWLWGHGRGTWRRKMTCYKDGIGIWLVEPRNFWRVPPPQGVSHQGSCDLLYNHIKEK